MIWAALRFDARAVTLIVVADAVAAVWWTAVGASPFDTAARNESLLPLQGFVAILVMTTLTLFASNAGRELAESVNAATRERVLRQRVAIFRMVLVEATQDGDTRPAR